MKSRLFPPGCVCLVVNREAIHSSCACSARTGLQASAATLASSMLLESPATPLPDEKILRFHLARYGLGLVLRVVGNADQVEVVVEDNGAGVASSLQQHIFDLFTQAEWTLDRTQGGLGLGLALVKSLVELHGGEVEMRSEGVGKGSVFTVILPREKGVHSEPERGGLKSGLSQTANPVQVLIVDDNRDAGDTLSLLLQTWTMRYLFPAIPLMPWHSRNGLRLQCCL